MPWGQAGRQAPQRSQAWASSLFPDQWLLVSLSDQVVALGGKSRHAQWPSARLRQAQQVREIGTALCGQGKAGAAAGRNGPGPRRRAGRAQAVLKSLPFQAVCACHRRRA